MADPAWGATLTDEETALALCAFHQKAPVGGSSGSGIWTAASSPPERPMAPASANSNVPRTAMRSPTTSSSAWVQQQQQQPPRHQARRTEPQHQPRTNDSHPTAWSCNMNNPPATTRVNLSFRDNKNPHQGLPMWNNDAPRPPSTSLGTPSFHDNRNLQHQLRHSTMMTSSGFYQPLQTSLHPTVQPYEARVDAGSMSTIGGMFAQQVGWGLLANYQAQSSQRFSRNASRSWTVSYNETATSPAQSFQEQATPMFTQQMRSLPTSRQSNGSDSEDAAFTQATSFVPDQEFLDSIGRHISSGRNAVSSERGFSCTQGHGSISMESQQQTQMELHIQRQTLPPQQQVHYSLVRQPRQQPHQQHIQARLELQPRPPILPTGAVVVPGMSLAAPTRRLSMRDILAGDDIVPDNSVVGPARKRSKGGKKIRPPPKRKTPRKRAPVKNRRPVFSQQPLNPTMGQNQPSGLPSMEYQPIRWSSATQDVHQAAGFTSTKQPIPWISVSSQPRLSVLSTRSSIHKSADRDPASASTQTKKTRVSCKKKRDSVEIEKMPVTTNPSDLPSLHSTVATLDQSTRATSAVPIKPMCELSQRYIKMEPHLESIKLAQHSSYNDGTSVQTSLLDGSLWDQQSPSDSLKKEIPGRLVEVGLRGHRDSTEPKSRPKLKIRRSQKIPIETNEPAATGSLTSAAMEPTINSYPRMENNTVVIFCRRDFMRYQAAKIWRRFQEQLQRQEEWREVRVAGKRTRYLNSRYDDEVRRSHNKAAHKKKGKSRKRASKKVVSAGCMQDTLRSSTMVRVGGILPVDAGIDSVLSPGKTARGARFTRPAQQQTSS